jgi:hypothetical protein
MPREGSVFWERGRPARTAPPLRNVFKKLLRSYFALRAHLRARRPRSYSIISGQFDLDVIITFP